MYRVFRQSAVCASLAGVPTPRGYDTHAADVGLTRQVTEGAGQSDRKTVPCVCGTCLEVVCARTVVVVLLAHLSFSSDIFLTLVTLHLAQVTENVSHGSGAILATTFISLL